MKRHSTILFAVLLGALLMSACGPSTFVANPGRVASAC